ncbi:TPA: hypothetical protein L4E80_002171 [Pseudomonas aeruginosa]|nr:hypothetical protein [Pseudomonas aeruginosa]
MDTSPHLAAWQEIDPPPRFRRLLTGFGISGVDSRVGAGWVGACTVSFLMDGVQHQDVLSSIDDALLVAGLLNSPTVGASEIRVVASAAVEGVYSSAIEWGHARFGEKALGELLSWWSLRAKTDNKAITWRTVKVWSWFKIYFSVVTKAFYEVAFVLLPVAVWMVVIFSVGGTKEEIKSLVAWPFAGLALFGASLRDGISAFHQDTPFDKRQREIIIAGSLIGVVLCTVLMTLGVLKARGDLSYLFSAFREMVFILLLSGIALLLVVKAILAQRKDFGIYKGQP